jgi:RimJ/RimL family protein N-acetyltransferase
MAAEPPDEPVGGIAGTCQISFHDRIKLRHRAGVAIGIIRKYWNLGVGTAMFREMIAAARKRGVTQLELEFIQGNTRARALASHYRRQD